MNAVLQRLAHIMLAWLILLDVIACTAWLSPLYLIGLADRPTGRDLISAYVGRCAISGAPWALIAEDVINALFWWDDDHCRATYLKYRSN